MQQKRSITVWAYSLCAARIKLTRLLGHWRAGYMYRLVRESAVKNRKQYKYIFERV